MNRGTCPWFLPFPRLYDQTVFITVSSCSSSFPLNTFLSFISDLPSPISCNSSSCIRKAVIVCVVWGGPFVRRWLYAAGKYRRGSCTTVVGTLVGEAQITQMSYKIWVLLQKRRDFCGCRGRGTWPSLSDFFKTNFQVLEAPAWGGLRKTVVWRMGKGPRQEQNKPLTRTWKGRVTRGAGSWSKGETNKSETDRKACQIWGQCQDSAFPF